MIDLHTHVLPGIDDGAKSLEEAAEMCRLAARDGCEALVATPHQRRGAWWNSDPEELAALCRRVQQMVGSEIRLHTGGEIHVGPRLLGEVLRLPEGTSGVLPLAGSRYLLLEFDAAGTPAEAVDLVHELVVEGWRPILAHPEFIPWMADDLAVVERLVDLGALAQVTAMSVTGDFGRRPEADVQRMIGAGLVHFVASDCHGPRRRPPGLKRAERTIAGRWGEETARRLVADNPRAVIEDRPLPREPVGAAGLEQDYR